ncbi:hypothetical protein HDU99_004259, partial [Rhizoclosmatium hyalinum]
MADQFEALWRNQQAAYELDQTSTGTNPEAVKPSVVRILIKMIGRKYLTVGALKFVSDIGFCSAPLLMKALISFIQHSSSAQISAGPGYGYAIGIFVISMISSVCFGFFFQRCNKFGMI